MEQRTFDGIVYETQRVEVPGGTVETYTRGNGPDVVFLLALSGVSQILWGAAYLFVVLRDARLAPLAMLSEVVRGIMVLLTEYWLKPPVSPVPGRYMHLATTAVCAVVLLLGIVERRSRLSDWARMN